MRKAPASPARPAASARGARQHWPEGLPDQPQARFLAPKRNGDQFVLATSFGVAIHVAIVDNRSRVESITDTIFLRHRSPRVGYTLTILSPCCFTVLRKVSEFPLAACSTCTTVYANLALPQLRLNMGHNFGWFTPDFIHNINTMAKAGPAPLDQLAVLFVAPDLEDALMKSLGSWKPPRDLAPWPVGPNHG